MTETFLDALCGRVTKAHDHNPNAGVAPIAVLWPDENRQWEGAIEALRERLPLLTLGDFDPEIARGPAYWVRCALAGKVDVALAEGPTVLYLPGVARSELRAVESCPAELAPIAELQYRANWLTQDNSKGVTIRSFLKNALGCHVADDEATTKMIGLALRALLDMPVAKLTSQWLDADFFADLVNPDSVLTLLNWIDDSVATRRRLDDAQWASFVQQCKADFGFDPSHETEVAAARKLGEHDSGWPKVWKRFAETPERFPGVVERLRQAKPMELTFDPSPAWPQDNEIAEEQLGKLFTEFASLTAEGARNEAARLEQEHGWRRSTVWAALGQAPLAFAIEQLARLADLTVKPLASQSMVELVEDYSTRGWRADDALLAALAAVPEGEGRQAVVTAARTIYMGWADHGATSLQKLVADPSSGQYQPQSPRSPENGVATLFVDGLRLDLAHRLAERIGDASFDVVLETSLAALPSVTETAKPSIMPVAEGTLLAGPDFHAASAETGTKATIQVTRGLLEKNGVAVLTATEDGSPTGAAWTEAGEIDHRGHDVGARLVDYLDEDLERIARRVRDLLSAGWNTIDIVTDHGWLLIPGGMPKIELPVSTTQAKKGRCARLKTSAHVDVPTVPWRWDADVTIAVAPGVGCFEINKEYEHGGISPQECVVPQLRVTAGSAAAASTGIDITKVKWLGLLCRVEFTGEPEGVVVDLRALAGDPSTSIADEAKATTTDGKVSLVVPDEDHSGEKVYLVMAAADGRVLAQRELTVGRNQ